MQLKDISLMASKQASPPAEKGFRGLTHHVTELFAHFLPKGYSLDGSAKITVTCGPRGPEPGYLQVLGTSNFFFESFDFKAFYSMNGDSRDQMALDVLKESLLSIARIKGKDLAVTDPVVEVARMVSDSAFRAVLPVKKLSKVHGARKNRVVVWRCLSHETGEAWLAELLGSSRVKLAEKWMTANPGCLDMREHFREACFDDDMYKVMDRFGKAIFEWNISEY